MKETPILFSANMVKAILEGRKTQTRRIIKLQPKKQHSFISQSTVLDKSNRITWTYSDENSINCVEVKFPFGKIGDFLWVKETYQIQGNTTKYYVYKADKNESIKNWKPSLFMPKSAARIWLRITNVRVERLNDISEEDAIAEGIESKFPDFCDSIRYGFNGKLHYNYLEKGIMQINSITSFETLWQSIHSEQSWNDNPLVWVIEFERIITYVH